MWEPTLEGLTDFEVRVFQAVLAQARKQAQRKWRDSIPQMVKREYWARLHVTLTIAELLMGNGARQACRRIAKKRPDLLLIADNSVQAIVQLMDPEAQAAATKEDKQERAIAERHMLAALHHFGAQRCTQNNKNGCMCFRCRAKKALRYYDPCFYKRLLRDQIEDTLNDR